METSTSTTLCRVPRASCSPGARSLWTEPWVRTSTPTAPSHTSPRTRTAERSSRGPHRYVTLSARSGCAMPERCGVIDDEYGSCRAACRPREPWHLVRERAPTSGRGACRRRTHARSWRTPCRRAPCSDTTRRYRHAVERHVSPVDERFAQISELRVHDGREPLRYGHLTVVGIVPVPHLHRPVRQLRGEGNDTEHAARGLYRDALHHRRPGKVGRKASLDRCERGRGAGRPEQQLDREQRGSSPGEGRLTRCDAPKALSMKTHAASYGAPCKVCPPRSRRHGFEQPPLHVSPRERLSSPLRAR